MLSNTEFVTAEQVANYYEVDRTAVRQIITRNSDELESDGIKYLTGNEIRDMYDTSDRMSQVSNLVNIEGVRGGILINDVKVAYSNK